MASWKRNLLFVFISQFCSIASFSLALPFAPYYIQELGVTDPDAVKFWASVSQAATGVSLAIMGPIWGALSDRYGRKLMMLRANFAAIFVLAAMAYSPNVLVFTLLRFAQGAFTGTMNAAMTFVATSAPTERHGSALGMLSAAVFSGAMAGPAIGGMLADTIGYSATFMIASVLMTISASVVMLGVEEHFVRPERSTGGDDTAKGSPQDGSFGTVAPLQWALYSISSKARSLRGWLAGIGPYLPLLLLMMVMSASRTFDRPILPLFVQELHGQLKGAARWTGMLAMVGAIGGMLAGVFLGRLADRIAPPRIGKASALGSAIALLVTGLATSLWMLFPLRFVYAFCAGGLDPVFQVWLSKSTPEAKRGTIFGWSVTAKSIGWAISPLASGAVAVWFGIPAVYIVAPALFLLLIPLIAVASRMASRTMQTGEPAGKSAAE